MFTINTEAGEIACVLHLKIPNVPTRSARTRGHLAWCVRTWEPGRVRVGEHLSVCPMQLKEAVAALGVSKDAVRHRIRLIIIRFDKPWWSRSLPVGSWGSHRRRCPSSGLLPSPTSRACPPVLRGATMWFHWTSSIGASWQTFFYRADMLLKTTIQA